MIYNILAGISDAALIAIIAAFALVAAAAVYVVFRLIKSCKKQPKTEPAVSGEETEAAEPVGPAEEPAEEKVEEVEPEPAVEELVEEEPVVEEAVEEEASPAPAEEPAEVTPEVEPAEEPVEEKPEGKPAADEDDVDEKDDDVDDDKDDDATVKTVARYGDHVRFIIIKYKKSFTAKLIQASDESKNYYSQIKNELLSYKGVKSRISWKHESFTAGRLTLAKLCYRGKNLCLFLPLDPKEYADSKYIVDDMSEVLAYEKTPLLYRIKNDRRLNYSKELIAEVMGEREKLEDFKAVNYAKNYPYEEIEPLVERNLVKVLTEEDAQSGDVFKPRDYVQASEVNELLQDDIAVALIEEDEEVSDRTKIEIINIDTLSKFFENGETVTLQEIKKRVPKFPKNATYIKVLARGVLDKKLKVIADSYSIEAAKMILLTGGNAIKKKNG